MEVIVFNHDPYGTFRIYSGGISSEVVVDDITICDVF